jgi:hypothetical protein
MFVCACPECEVRQGREETSMAREMLNTITAKVVSVVDESYGGYERDGKEVELVERYGVYVLQDFGQEPIGPLMATSEEDVAVAKRLESNEVVDVRVSTVAVVDRWGKGHLQHRAPRDSGPVFMSLDHNGVDRVTGEIGVDSNGR